VHFKQFHPFQGANTTYRRDAENAEKHKIGVETLRLGGEIFYPKPTAFIKAETPRPNKQAQGISAGIIKM
jgi:hypothetical protein